MQVLMPRITVICTITFAPLNLGKVKILTSEEKWLCAGHSDQLENHRYHQRHLTPENVTGDTVTMDE
jgi:hypothetical protein